MKKRRWYDWAALVWGVGIVVFLGWAFQILPLIFVVSGILALKRFSESGGSEKES